MNGLTPLEREALQMLVDGDASIKAVLRQQLETASVSGRETTGVGFFIEFSIPPNAPRLPNEPSFKLGNVAAEIVNLEHGAGFLLYVERGALGMLEGYTYDEPWPEKVSGFTLSYCSMANAESRSKQSHSKA